MLRLPITLFASAALIIASSIAHAEPLSEPVPSEKPSTAQRVQIDRKYGMFCHFGINTFINMEWSDGKVPPEKYAPPADLEEGIDEWVKTARDAGMRYFLCISKHHDGFCLWDSAHTDYDIANPAVSNHLDVVGAIAKSCKKHGISFALYYSLWDRHEPSYADPAKYRDYMVKQLTELCTKYGPISEMWFDGGWDRKNSKDWFIPDLYATIKKHQPDCQVAVNWSIGKPGNPEFHGLPPAQQQNGYPIRYFPSDFRLGDPALPRADDPKLFTHDDKTYYMPFESTVTVSKQNKWFHHTSDTEAKSVDELERLFKIATANDNLLVLNVPPARNGRLVPSQKQALLDLAKKLNLGPDKPFPKFEAPAK